MEYKELAESELIKYSWQDATKDQQTIHVFYISQNEHIHPSICHCCDGQWVWSQGSGPSGSTGRWLVGMPTGGRTFLIGLKLRGDEPGEWAGERTGRRGGPGRGCGRGCASGEGLRGYRRGADQMGRSVLLEVGGRTGAYVAGILISDWLTALPEHSSKCSRVSWNKMEIHDRHELCCL